MPAADMSMVPSTNAAPTVNTMPALTSTRPSTNIVTSSTSSRKWVMASPAEPTGRPACSPPLANWAARRLARRNDCMCTQAWVHTMAAPWMTAIRSVSLSRTAPA